MKRYQFSLSGLLLAVFFGAGLSAVTVQFAGTNWDARQKLIAYGVCMGLTLLLFFSLRGRLRAVAYLLLAPPLFVCAVIAAALFDQPRRVPVWQAPATTATSVTHPPAPPPPVLQTPLSGGAR
jgi:4-amino-4-deoxy-L-arabinose transferase-like glycosyltransferase